MSQGSSPAGWQQPNPLMQPPSPPKKKGVPGWLIAVIVIVVLLVVAPVTCLIAGGVAAVSAPKYAEAQRKQAKADAMTVQPIAEKYTIEHPGRCPTLAELRAAGDLSAKTKITDPWDSPYAIRCRNQDVYVISLGPDKQEGTRDDISIPSP